MSSEKVKTCACKIGPSILNADLSCLGDECQRMMDAGADYLHLDVMDGNFVPNITFGATMVKWLRKRIPNVFFDLHMMVSKPEQWVDEMAEAGVNQYTFHLEATDKPRELIQQIRKAGMMVGIGIKPGTPVEEVLPYVAEVDMVLVMTVEPGFGGQKFMEDMMPKVKELRRSRPGLDIEVDGGVGPATIESAAKTPVNLPMILPCKDYICTSDSWRGFINAGANMIVSGSAVVKSPDPASVIQQLKSVTEKWIEHNYKEHVLS